MAATDFDLWNMNRFQIKTGSDCFWQDRVMKEASALMIELENGFEL